MSTVEVMVTAQVPQSMIVALQRHFTVHHREHIQDPSVLHRVQVVVCAESSRISRDWMALLPQLRLICLTGSGTQGLDMQEVARRQIAVLPSPDVVSAERADFVMATLLGLCRQWPQADHFVREGDWVDGAFPAANRFSGMRVGLLGLGAAGLALIERLTAFGIRGACLVEGAASACVWPQVTDLPALLAQGVNALVILDEGLALRQGAIGMDALQSLLAPAYVVCLARSSVLDEAGVIAMLKSRKLEGLVLDDYPEAPRVPASWRQAPRTWVTPSIAAATVQAQADVCQSVIVNIAGHFGLSL